MTDKHDEHDAAFEEGQRDANDAGRVKVEDKPKRNRRCKRCEELFLPGRLKDWRRQEWLCERCAGIVYGSLDVPV